MNPALQPDTALVHTIVERRRETRRPLTQARIFDDGTASSLWCWSDDNHAVFVLSSYSIEFGVDRALVEHTREPGVPPISTIVIKEQRAAKLKGGLQQVSMAHARAVRADAAHPDRRTPPRGCDAQNGECREGNAQSHSHS